MSIMSQDFTIERYREILSAAARRFRFIRFGEVAGSGSEALWRHDIDFSPQRALDLARIERESNVLSTFFFQVSSRYYSILEPETAGIARQIVGLGHAVGLHFDAEVCLDRRDPDFERRLIFEARVLEEVAETRVGAFSLHNPTTLAGVSFDGAEIAGLINASSPLWREGFSYCSDSNGVWRYRSLAEMIADPEVRKLYVLTHPEWWQAQPMPPRRRIQRCIIGRARFCSRYYDALLHTHERPNIGAVKQE